MEVALGPAEPAGGGGSEDSGAGYGVPGRESLPVADEGLPAGVLPGGAPPATPPGSLPAMPGGQALVFADPDLDDPRIAAARYRTLLSELETARATLDERVRAGQAEVIADAQRHRDAAETIRAKVEEIWDAVGRPLAQYGLGDLDQLRPPPSDTPVAVDDAGRPHARAGRRSERRGGDGPRLPARSGPMRPVGATVDPDRAPQEAYELCRDAMAKAAELRALSRGGASVSVGLVAGAACLLVGTLTALARFFFDAPALPCLGVGAVAGWLAVTSVAGGGRLAAVRTGLVAAGTAGVAVLATLRLVPPDPAGLAASLVVVALAIRFGLGFGSHGTEPVGKARGGRGRAR